MFFKLLGLGGDMKLQADDIFWKTIKSLRSIQELCARFDAETLREDLENPKIRLTPSAGVTVADIRNILFGGLVEKIDEELKENGLPWRVLFHTDYDKEGECAITMHFRIPGPRHLPEVKLGKDAGQEDDYEIVKSAVERTSFHMAIHPVLGRTPGQIYKLLLENGLPTRYFFRKEENTITSPRRGVIVEIAVPVM